MSDEVCREPNLRVLLGFYAIDKLDDEERLTLERHLSDCAMCRADRDQVVPVVPALRLLSDTDIRELVEEFAASAAAPAVRPRAGRPPRRPDDAGGSPGRPDQTRQRRRRRRLSIGALVVVAVAGVVTAFAGWQPDQTQPAPVSIVASGDNATGIAISVAVAGQGAKATLTGLRESVRYELYVVAADGQTFRLAELTGGSGVQQAGGELPVPAADVAFFSLRQADGTVVVTAAVPQPDPAPPPT